MAKFRINDNEYFGDIIEFKAFRFTIFDSANNSRMILQATRTVNSINIIHGTIELSTDIPVFSSNEILKVHGGAKIADKLSCFKMNCESIHANKDLRCDTIEGKTVVAGTGVRCNSIIYPTEQKKFGPIELVNKDLNISEPNLCRIPGFFNCGPGIKQPVLDIERGTLSYLECPLANVYELSGKVNAGDIRSHKMISEKISSSQKIICDRLTATQKLILIDGSIKCRDHKRIEGPSTGGGSVQGPNKNIKTRVPLEKAEFSLF